LISIVAFGFAWWLGLYLLARDVTKPVLLRAGIGLLGYALALATADLRDDHPALAAVHAVLLSVPSVMWTGVFVALVPRHPVLDGVVWRWVVLPVAPVFAAASPFVGAWSAGVAVLPLFSAFGLLMRDRAHIGRGMALAAPLMFCLMTALLVVSLSSGEPRTVLLPAIGVDLVLLGGCVAVFDAFDEGETIRRDMLWSLLVAGGTAVLFGSQVALAAWLVDRSLMPLAYGVVGAAITVQVLARPINALADHFAFRDPAMRRERGDLRAVAAALPRRAEVPLAEFDDAEFARLTRRALSHYGDLGKLASSPLTALLVITERLAERGVPAAPLARATELKTLLLEMITRLRPAAGDFGTSEEWRHYNALYFYYVAGVRPYSVRTKVTELDPVARRALAWFADHVPERTLHNWQAAAARIVAAELRLSSSRQ